MQNNRQNIRKYSETKPPYRSERPVLWNILKKWADNTIFGVASPLYWHESCTILVQLRRASDVVRFLHLFKFGLVVLQNLFLEHRELSRDTSLLFLYSVKLWLLPRRGRVVCEVCCDGILPCNTTNCGIMTLSEQAPNVITPQLDAFGITLAPLLLLCSNLKES